MPNTKPDVVLDAAAIEALRQVARDNHGLSLVEDHALALIDLAAGAIYSREVPMNIREMEILWTFLGGSFVLATPPDKSEQQKMALIPIGRLFGFMRAMYACANEARDFEAKLETGELIHNARPDDGKAQHD
jgi:hypothetical protein